MPGPTSGFILLNVCMFSVPLDKHLQFAIIHTWPRYTFSGTRGLLNWQPLSTQTTLRFFYGLGSALMRIANPSHLHFALWGST